MAIEVLLGMNPRFGMNEWRREREIQLLTLQHRMSRKLKTDCARNMQISERGLSQFM